MLEENSLGPMGPNVTSVEAVSDTVYSVEGHNFEIGFQVEVRDGVDQGVAGSAISNLSGTSFTLTLPYTTPGPFTLVVRNPDGRTSTQRFETPGTSASNSALRADS